MREKELSLGDKNLNKEVNKWRGSFAFPARADECVSSASEFDSRKLEQEVTMAENLTSHLGKNFSSKASLVSYHNRLKVVGLQIKKNEDALSEYKGLMTVENSVPVLKNVSKEFVEDRQDYINKINQEIDRTMKCFEDLKKLEQKLLSFREEKNAFVKKWMMKLEKNIKFSKLSSVEEFINIEDVFDIKASQDLVEMYGHKMAADIAGEAMANVLVQVGRKGNKDNGSELMGRLDESWVDELDDVCIDIDLEKEKVLLERILAEAILISKLKWYRQLLNDCDETGVVSINDGIVQQSMNLMENNSRIINTLKDSDIKKIHLNLNLEGLNNEKETWGEKLGSVWNRRCMTKRRAIKKTLLDSLNFLQQNNRINDLKREIRCGGEKTQVIMNPSTNRTKELSLADFVGIVQKNLKSVCEQAINDNVNIVNSDFFNQIIDMQREELILSSRINLMKLEDNDRLLLDVFLDSR